MNSFQARSGNQSREDFTNVGVMTQDVIDDVNKMWQHSGNEVKYKDR